MCYHRLPVLVSDFAVFRSKLISYTDPETERQHCTRGIGIFCTRPNSRTYAVELIRK